MQACDEIEKVVDDMSSERQEVVPCSVKELALVGIQEKVSFKKSNANSYLLVSVIPNEYHKHANSYFFVLLFRILFVPLFRAIPLQICMVRIHMRTWA
jgi:hypothetical protein